MIEGKFDVIFRGQIVKSFELAQVKQNLVQLFKSSPAAIERLFTGQETTIRKALDYTSAMKYQSALKSAGALALIKEVPVAADEQLNGGAPTDANQATSVSAADDTVPAVESTDDKSASPVGEGADLTMAEVGAQILPPKIYEKREVDTSELSLAQAGERILPPRAPEDHPVPSIDHLSLE